MILIYYDVYSIYIINEASTKNKMRKNYQSLLFFQMIKIIILYLEM